MWNVQTKFIVIAILLALAIGGAVIEANATVGAVQGLRLEEAQKNAGDVHLIRSWMTVPYIAHVYHIPTSTLYQSLHVENTHAARHSTLENIALHTRRPVNSVVSCVQTAIVAYRKQHPTPRALPTPQLHHYPQGGKAQ